MKKTTTLLATILVTVSIWAQSPQKMSYQAVIRNASNTLVTNTAVGIQISILQTTNTGTAVYVETQTPTTNANGLVSIEIGAGTPVTGTFTGIDWAAGPYFIKTETDPAGGSTYTITGTSQLLSVPYALSAGNVTGLEKITEGANTGWRLVGQNPANYGDIGSNATDLSDHGSASTTHGATGNNSTALGANTTASGILSTALGNNTVASGTYAVAMGYTSVASGTSSTVMGDLSSASGVFSTAMGYQTLASGDYSLATGDNTRANASNSTAMGRYNMGGGNSSSWVTTEPLFEIGNGTVTTPSNALTVLKNGTITAPSLTNTLITTAGAKALITKEYADANLTSTGLEKITEGINTGWRLVGRDPARYGNIGNGATDLSYSSTASTTNGATGNNSTALGANTTASGIFSTALGYNTVASGTYAVAMGNTSVASGVYSLATGDNTNANASNSTAIGRYNIGGGSPSLSVSTDPLFEIGNGTSNVARSNALTVLKNGNTDVNGVFRATGNVWPSTGAGVEIAYDPYKGYNCVPLFGCGSFGAGYVQAYNRDTAEYNPLFLGAIQVSPVIDNFTSLGTVSKKWTAVYAVNGTIQTSDRRMKKDINNIEYGLNTIMQLRPVSYKWIKGNQDLNLGLIAQEVQKVLPEVVDVGTDKDKTLGMNYSELIPVLIKAIQEQQQEINELKKLVNKLLQKKIVARN